MDRITGINLHVAPQPAPTGARSAIAALIGRPVPDPVPGLILALMLAAVLFDAALVLIEIRTGWDDRPLHALTALILTALALLAMLAGCWQLQRWLAARPGQLSAGERQSLQDACLAAETANLTKSRYLANVSHEIRSPLNAIYGYAQLVEQGAGVDPREAARVIRRCAEHMTGLVESLLDISQLENGILRLRSEIVGLEPFLDQVICMMRPAAAAKGLDFIYEPPARMPEFIRMDQSRFRQVLINLLSNAIKFTERGSVTLRVGYSGQIATFSVIDTGPGIAPDDLERIFMPFDRGGAADCALQPGVGLGLPIARAIVEILGGKLDVASTPGEGACFKVTLMLGEVASLIQPDARLRRIVGHEGPRRSILVVDDDPEQRAFLDHFLSGCGLDAVAVPNGETALMIAAGRAFDLALLDISLPGMSGWEIAEKLRERCDHDIQIVMLSANAGEFHRPEFDRPMHDHFLTKPVRLDALADTIGALLKLSWKWEATDPDRAAATGRRLPAPSLSASPLFAPLPDGAGEHVERLRELLRIGYARGIEAEIKALARLMPPGSPLVRDLFECLDRFDLAAMGRLLEGR